MPTGSTAQAQAGCPECSAPWGQRLLCPNDGALRHPGVVIGERYELERLLGRGGMGFVYAARHKLLRKPVAVKLLREDLTRDAEQVGRFLREAQLCSQLSHDNIVDIIDFGRDGVHLYLVMEMLGGETLADLLAREGKLPLRRALGILRQLCRALGEAHEAGIVHRDLTPRNVMLVEASGRSDLVKLLDFGISRLAGGQDRVTGTGVPLGTTPYMPPEQLRGAPEQDRRVDIYALGVITTEMITGTLPFSSDNPAEQIAEKLAREGADITATGLTQLAPGIARLVSECLIADPRRRPASVSEVEQRLLASGPAVQQSDDLVGVRAGSFRLTGLLGSGGLGSVWAGEHPVIGSRVAVKILHPEMCEADEAVRRFVVEAQAVNRIASPQIVKTFDFGKLPDGRDYAVMELLEGETLAERLSRGRLAWNDLRPIASQLVQGLVAAHEAGIVHRDLKPENIHLGASAGEPAVKILDFGIAKLLESEAAATHQTKLGVCIGTPLYAAPEQVAGERIGQAADIYALGVVFFEALAGVPPFAGTIQQVVQAKLAHRPQPVASVAPGLPAKVAALIDRMLERSAAARPDAAEVLAVLSSSEAPEVALAATALAPRPLPSAATGPGATNTASEPVLPNLPAKRWPRYLLFGSGVVLVAVVLGWLLAAVVWPSDRGVVPGGQRADQAEATDAAPVAVATPAASGSAAEPSPADAAVADLGTVTGPPPTATGKPQPSPSAPTRRRGARRRAGVARSSKPTTKRERPRRPAKKKTAKPKLVDPFAD